MRFRQQWIERERRLELRDGKVGLRETAVDNRQMTANRRCARIGFHRANERRQRALWIAEPQPQDADGVQGFGIVGQIRLQALEGRDRACPISCLQRFERAGEEPAVEPRASWLQRGQASLLFTHRKGSIGT